MKEAPWDPVTAGDQPLGVAHAVTRRLYRAYRGLKQWVLGRPNSLVAKVVFWPIETLRGMLGRPTRRATPRPEQALWKSLYFLRFPTPPFVMRADQTFARDSDDFRWPRGAVYDNSGNRAFNCKLLHYFNHKRDLSVMDLGCAGGGFVRGFIEDGFTAVGVEGAEAPLLLRAAEWDTIPFHLFNADISRPFTVTTSEGQPACFDCITAWEVLEHIPEERLPALFDNIKRHLAPAGIFVGSVDMTPDADPFTGAVYHVTLRDRDWWMKAFAAAGLVSVDRHPFQTRDFVRGHGMGIKDWDPADGGGFHVVMRHAPT